MTRDSIIAKVLADTKRTDKQTYLEGRFTDVLHTMSRAVTEDAEPIPLQDLKTIGTIAITTSSYYKALPTGFIFQYGEPELLYDTDKGRQLIKKSLDWMNWNYSNRANNTSNKAKPIYYCLENNRFDFAPMSDAAYTVNFPHTLLHPTVDDNGDTILFRDQFEVVIKDLLKAELFELLEDFDKVSLYTNRAMNNLRSLAKLDKRNSGTVLITNVNDY